MINNERIIAPARFSHASAITPWRDGVLLACYTGDAECHQSQRVCIYYVRDNGKISKPKFLEDYTGNPVFLQSSKFRHTKIIYSKFEKLVRTRVKWWQHCSLWSRDVEINSIGGVSVGPEQQLKFDGEENQPADFLGYLPRCNPIVVDDGYLLPLYKEHEPEYHGTVLHSKDGINWTYQGTIGKGVKCIQPTLWHEGGKIHALLRNFNRGTPASKRFAYYSTSEDNGKTWSEPTLSKFPNCNNSILAINCRNRETRKDQVLYIWNNDMEGRRNLTLGTAGQHPLVVLGGYGSYPAACIHNNKLHITYTAPVSRYKAPHAKMAIKYKQYHLLQLLNESLKYNQ